MSLTDSSFINSLINAISKAGVDLSTSLKIINTLESFSSISNRLPFLSDTSKDNLIDKLAETFEPRLRSLIKQILNSFEEILLKKSSLKSTKRKMIGVLRKKIFDLYGIKPVQIISACVLDYKQRSILIEIAKKFGASENDYFTFEVSSEIIGGVRIFLPDKLVDFSFESLITDVYNRL